jgi:hypothetical protein
MSDFNMNTYFNFNDLEHEPPEFMKHWPFKLYDADGVEILDHVNEIDIASGVGGLCVRDAKGYIVKDTNNCTVLETRLYKAPMKLVGRNGKTWTYSAEKGVVVSD